jgi:hypothetical protein
LDSGLRRMGRAAMERQNLSASCPWRSTLFSLESAAARYT